MNLIINALRDGTEGKAKAQGPEGALPLGNVNIIPSQVKGECKDVLLAFCFDGDSFEDRLREIVQHVGISCPRTRVVILTTSQWNPKVWKRKYEEAFTNMQPCVAIYLEGIAGLTRIG
jgi:hypothetical protein